MAPIIKGLVSVGEPKAAGRPAAKKARVAAVCRSLADESGHDPLGWSTRSLVDFYLPAGLCVLCLRPAHERCDRHGTHDAGTWPDPGRDRWAVAGLSRRLPDFSAPRRCDRPALVRAPHAGRCERACAGCDIGHGRAAVDTD